MIKPIISSKFSNTNNYSNQKSTVISQQSFEGIKKGGIIKNTSLLLLLTAALSSLATSGVTAAEKATKAATPIKRALTDTCTTSTIPKEQIHKGLELIPAGLRAKLPKSTLEYREQNEILGGWGLNPRANSAIADAYIAAKKDGKEGIDLLIEQGYIDSTIHTKDGEDIVRNVVPMGIGNTFLVGYTAETETAVLGWLQKNGAKFKLRQADPNIPQAWCFDPKVKPKKK